MLDDVLQGLSGQPKTLPSRLLYDARGSDLFEDITALPEYYPTRTERAILTEAAPALADAIGPGAVLVEYGAGASVKTRILLDDRADVCNDALRGGVVPYQLQHRRKPYSIFDAPRLLPIRSRMSSTYAATNIEVSTS